MDDSVMYKFTYRQTKKTVTSAMCVAKYIYRAVQQTYHSHFDFNHYLI